MNKRLEIKKIIGKYYEELQRKGLTPDESQLLFLRFLIDEGILSRGPADTDEYVADIPDAAKIDRIISNYYRVNYR